MNKKLLLYLFAIMIISGCKDNLVHISGTLINPVKGNYIYLGEMMSNDIKPVDSVQISDDGAFRFKREIEFPAFYLLKITDRNFLTMLLKPGEKINLNSHYDSLNYPISVTGSEGTELMNEYNRKLRNTINQLSGLNNIYSQNINNPQLPAVIESLDSIAQTYLDEINSYTKSYIDKNLTSLVSLIALYQQVAPNVYVLNPSKDHKYFIKVDSSLSLLYSDYEPVKTLHQQVQQMIGEVGMGDRKTASA